MIAWRLNSDLPLKPSARSVGDSEVPVKPPALGDSAVKHPALGVSEIVELLTGSVPSKRVGQIVQQYGVNFTLDDKSKRKIQDAGGDAALLLLISKAKR
jgi:hypothetical protein